MLAVNLRRLRHLRGWSQEELADRTGIHRTYISGLERGLRNPTVSSLDLMAAAFAVEPEELIRRSQ